MGTPFQEQGLGALVSTTRGGLNSVVGSVAAGTYDNTNGGGGVNGTSSGAGGSGYCLVWWYE